VIHNLSKAKIPHSDKELEGLFRSLLAGETSVSIRPMFGNLAAFVNGNMFAGLYGNDFFVRLSEEESQKLLKHEGASLFEPMKGRPMKGYYLIPRSWKVQQDLLRSWILKSRSSTSKLPSKKKGR